MKRQLITLVLAAGICATPSVRAGTTGKIAGEVKDAQSGEALIGANIVVEGTSFGAATNIDGYYVILNLPPGKYTLAASAIGYTKKAIADVSVSIDLTTTIDIQMTSTVVDVGEEVVVTAERPIVRKDLTSSEARVDAGTIENLPVSEVSEVLSLQAGITKGTDGGIHIRGGRTSEVAYWVDGVSVSDVYDGSQAVQVDNNSVQELQVISGTFNAEYGQAMSGIVNIVTKDGDQQLRGSLSVYSGDYVVSDGWTFDDRRQLLTNDFQPSFVDHDKLFYNLNKVKPFANYNVEGSLSGPVPGIGGLTFYFSGRYFRSDGYLYGLRLVNPFGQINPAAIEFQQDGNEAYLITHDVPVSMNGRQRRSGQAKLTYQFSGTTKLNLSGLISSIDYRDYNNDYRLNPDADVRKFDRGYNYAATWNHSLGSTAFYTVNLSYFLKRFREYLYEDPTDPRYFYVDPTLAARNSAEFIVVGVNNHQFKRTTETRVAKIDYTDQVSQLHQIKAGLEGKLHTLYLEDYNVTYPPETNFLPAIPPLTSPLYEEYTERPIELSAYLQDKLEYERMIVNVGLRFDYFNSRGKVLADPQDPNVYLPLKEVNKALTLEERLAKWYTKASPKYSVSPRFGISYPITDKGVLHFSYGHFLQIPSFINLYQKPGYKVSSSDDVQGTYGNPDLDAQKTVMYEFGLQQQLSDALSFDITSFYRDTRNWVTTSPPISTVSTSRYVIYINRDYANSKGLTLSVNKRPGGDLFTMNFSYTFQIAEGINSNPDDALAATRSNAQPAQSLTPLDWDQTHTANLTLGVGKSDWGVFVLGRYGSGLPYSPALNQVESQGADISRTVKENSRRRPANYTVDMRAFKNVEFGPLNLSFFVKVFNLFDRRNENDVFGTTGRATTTPEIEGLAGLRPVNGVNSVAEYLIRPNYYSEPREVQIGVDLNF